MNNKNQKLKDLELNFNMFKILDHKKSNINYNEPMLKLIAGDASDRKFYRLMNYNNRSAICMQFPKWEGGYGGDPISWIGMHKALHLMHLPIPKIYEIEEANSCIWTEDLGDNFLNSLLDKTKLDLNDKNCSIAIDYYKKSIDLLILAQYPDVVVDHPALNRFFDYEKLYYEMNFFITHFLNGLLNLNVQANDKNWIGLYEDFDLLCKKIDCYNKVLCHRDYHVRNIMINNDQLYWIDFQDARMGVHSYDVVSLLRDSYVDITWDTRQYLFNYYLKSLNVRRTKLNLNLISYSDFHLESLLMGLQRNVKALGSFGYLATKKSKPAYLKYIKNTLDILTSKQSQQHEVTDLQQLMPSIFRLFEDLQTGKYKNKINDIISRNI